MVEQGIQIPDSAKRKPGRKAGTQKYPWRECLNVGDSFPSSETLKRTLFAVRQFNYRNKSSGLKFAAAESCGAVRVWRVE